MLSSEIVSAHKVAVVQYLHKCSWDVSLRDWLCVVRQVKSGQRVGVVIRDLHSLRVEVPVVKEAASSKRRHHGCSRYQRGWQDALDGGAKRNAVEFVNTSVSVALQDHFKGILAEVLANFRYFVGLHGL